MKDRMTKNQRLQVKGLVCVLALLLLLFLLVGRILTVLMKEDGQAPEENPPVPDVQVYRNVWIQEENGQELKAFWQGENRVWSVSQEVDAVFGGTVLRDEIGDVTLTDGVVTDILLKRDRVHGTVHLAGDGYVELEREGKGERYPIAPDCAAYQLYGTPSMKSIGDLAIGYDFADFVLEEGEICAVLFTRTGSMEKIRVLIGNDDYEGIFHENLELTCDSPFTVKHFKEGETSQETYDAGKTVHLKKDGLFLHTGEERWLIEPELLTGKVEIRNLQRSREKVSFRGSMEVLKTGEGLVLVNELLLEEYLYSVVPSEMPAGWPLEALKAQSVCARTYACKYMLHAAYPQYGAHMGDSTAFQVYGNLEEQESTTLAVKETLGQILADQEGQPAPVYYFSTSCGRGTDERVWQEERTAPPALTGKRISRDDEKDQESGIWLDWELIPEGTDVGVLLLDSADEEDQDARFLLTVNSGDFERDMPWYRWTYTVTGLDRQAFLKKLESFCGEEAGRADKVTDLYVSRRGMGGVADELVIETDVGSYTVSGERRIREMLCDGVTAVRRQDGVYASCSSLLPSAFFLLCKVVDKGEVKGYTLIGGGYGHGAGMSQSAASQMALQGWSAQEILTFFYEGFEMLPFYRQEESGN